MGAVEGLCTSCRKPGVSDGVILAQTTAISLDRHDQQRSPLTTFSPIPIKSMLPTISIPQHWDYPRFALEQRTIRFAQIQNY
ncbi:hypothetical protein LC613_35945 [Nostoc sphaeroides CHAB 2801]|uniref:hypothetical protein n=1 Tax=Nostoc sphaeroides TaxID=446679 RepID=UPI001E4BE073|nr:hypothetical protein [Nostoc sphaeroides]MCC5632930.1 hypothetical protein [Nostoc sphaeroides CHAB 2801]